MASVHKKSRKGRKASPFYYASFRAPDGRQFYKSTKKTTRAEALAVAMEFERMVRGHTTEAHYRRVAADVYERTAGEPLNFHSCSEWLGEWLGNTKATVKGGTFEKYKGTVSDFLAFLGDRNAAPLASITPKDITSYRDELQQRGLAASTINLAVRKTLGAPFEAARRLGYITLNPCATVGPVRDTVPKSKARREVFSTEQIEAMLAASTGTDWQGAILCGMTTALRLGDIVGLTWGQVDMTAGLLRLTSTKSETEQVIPLHRAFRAWLESQERGIGNAAVFTKLHGREIGGNNGLSRMFQKKVMKPAGVLGTVIRSGANTETRLELKTRAGRTTSTLSFHSLRHTATSLLANAGVAADTRKAITGHADDRVHEGYTHHAIEKLREAVDSMPVPGTPAETGKAKGRKNS